jgi:hypothetical protein
MCCGFCCDVVSEPAAFLGFDVTMRLNMGYSSPLKARSRIAGRRASSSAAVSAWRRSGVSTPGISGREVMPLIFGKQL